MCLVRLKAEGKDGRYMYRKLVEMMWHDVEERMKNLGVWIKINVASISKLSSSGRTSEPLRGSREFVRCLDEKL